MRSSPFLSRWSCVSADRGISVSLQRVQEFVHTVQRDVEADGALGDPLANAVASAPLDACDQGAVINDTTKFLALGRLQCARRATRPIRPWRESAATHRA